MNKDQREYVRKRLDECASNEWVGVVPRDALRDKQLDRIEDKLDRVLEAMDAGVDDGGGPDDE